MSQNDTPYVGDLTKAHQFAHLLCTAADTGAFVTVQKGSGSRYIGIGDWAGIPYSDSRAPFAAPTKAAELHWKGTQPGQVVLTPTDLDIGLGWQGGARRGVYTVAVSKWAEQHDRLLALILLYSMEQEVRLHHVGTRFTTQEAFETASGMFGSNPIPVPASDHLRHYHHVESDLSANGEYWREFQFFPDGPHTQAIHWDLATSDPHGMLLFVATAFNTQPVFFNDIGINDPVGVVWVTGADGKIMGVMARDRWGDPATW